MELQLIQSRIFQIRGHRVILDFHLAELYEVEARILNQAVKRNRRRFPSDFMIQLSLEEWKSFLNVNIAIMRAFVVLRQHLTDYNELKEKISKLEHEMNRKFKDIHEALEYLLSPKSKTKEIGFKQKGRGAESVFDKIRI